MDTRVFALERDFELLFETTFPHRDQVVAGDREPVARLTASPWRTGSCRRKLRNKTQYCVLVDRRSIELMAHIDRRLALRREGAVSMSSEPPACRNCGAAMTFATRISMPRQVVYRCEPCKEQAWIVIHRPRHRRNSSNSRRRRRANRLRDGSTASIDGRLVLASRRLPMRQTIFGTNGVTYHFALVRNRSPGRRRCPRGFHVLSQITRRAFETL